MSETISNTQKALKGISSQTLVTVGLGVLEIVSFSIMSRLLTQEDFGYYAAITAITIVFSSFSETGIGSAIIQRKELTVRYINNAFTLSFIFGALITLSMFVLAKPLSVAVADSSMKVPLMLMSVTLLCNCLTSVTNSILHRQLKFFTIGLIHLISLVVTTVIAIVLAVKGLGYYAIITKAVLSSVLTLLLSWLFAKTNFRFALDKETIKSIFGFSGWLMASVFFRNLAQQMDRLLVTRLISVETLGAYNRPKDFVSQISNKIAGIFDSVLFPVLSQIQDNYISLRYSYLRSLYLINVCSLILSLGFVFNGELIIRIFFGQEWFNVLPVFRILSIAIIFSFEARLADCYLRSLGLTKQQFFFRIAEVILKIVALILGFHWGIIGIAISVLVTDIMMVGVKHYYISKKIELKLIDSFSVFYRSIQLLLIFLPILCITNWLLPNTISGEIGMICIYVLLSIIILLFFPNVVGKEYKNDYYPIVINHIKSILKIK